MFCFGNNWLSIPSNASNVKSLANEAVWIDGGILILTSVFGIFSNLMLIVGLKKTYQETLCFARRLYIYLAMADLFTSLVMEPFYIFSTVRPEKVSCNVFAFGIATGSFVFSLSMGLFMLISATRNLAIRKPFFEIKSVHISAYMSIVVFYCLAKAILTYLTFSKENNSLTIFSVFLTFNFFDMTITITVLTICNIWSRRTLKKPITNSKAPRNKVKNEKAVTTLILITVVYVTCNIPTALYYGYLAVNVFRANGKFDRIAEVINFFVSIHIPMFICPGLNSLIYVMRNGDVLQYYKEWVNGKPARRNTLETLNVVNVSTNNETSSAMKV